MCGRYTVIIDKNTIERHFNAKFFIVTIDFEATYSAAPSCQKR
jgi:hypothetical protein